jgi:glycosyltransferase involved in cell wall biosynthesis
MKILFITPKYIPALGGVETHVQKVSLALKKRGHHITIITAQSSKEMALTEDIDGVCIYRIPIEITQQKIATWQWIKANSAIFETADIVHVHDVGWWLLPVLPLIRPKLYITFHGWEGRWPIRWQAKLHRWILSKLSKKTIHIGNWIQEFYWDKPSIVLYGGVDRRNTAVQENQTKHKSKNILKLVFIGRLVKENDIASYCQYLDVLREKQIAFRIHWVGDGPWRKTCEKYGRVLGMVTKPKEFLVRADVVLASSFLSILLARSMGKPVWAMYSQPLKQKYLESLPNKEAMVVAGSADELVQATYDEKAKSWNPAVIASQYSKDWPPTWREVATAYETLWQSTTNHEKQ